VNSSLSKSAGSFRHRHHGDPGNPRVEPTTRLPRVPHYVAGVVNLRGSVLPVIDLAARLGWEATEPTPRHAIIVVQGAQVCGLIVDSVSDIVTINNDT
jgi:purine-binding chemotaxis protein CheW